MNRNTRRARKLGLSNNPEITRGTGEKRIIDVRHAEEIVKGICVDSAFGAPGNKNKSKKNYAKPKREGQ